ncbi:MAG: S8/S53 family peptidase [Caldilineaceae bacterium]
MQSQTPSRRFSLRQRWPGSGISAMLLTGFLLLLLVSGCILITPTPPPSPVPTPTPRAEDCRQISEAGREKRLSAEKLSGEGNNGPYSPDETLYVPGQVIMSGLMANMLPLADELQLEIIREPRTVDDTAIGLFGIGNERSVEEVVCVVNSMGREVVADPNYLLSPAQYTGFGSPWSESGSWSGLPGGGWAEADPALFPVQWALGPRGGELNDDAGNRLVGIGGDRTQIAIFDSSPFADAAEAEAVAGQLEMNLQLWDPIASQLGEKCPVNERDISSHGLFVAGLAHAVAPMARLHLIPVLNQGGCGDLYTIVGAIDQYVATAAQSEERTVINLSLGVHQPATPTDYGLPAEIVALEQVVQRAEAKDMVVVAAAGNDSSDKATPNDMELPANSTNVLGVAATNVEGMRSCFSNSGDLAAPGGDGIKLKNACDIPACPDGDPNCNLPVCSDSNPEPCLISWSIDPDSRKLHTVYWAGTSFATPLVSGLAALVLEVHNPPAPAVTVMIHDNGILASDPNLKRHVNVACTLLTGANRPAHCPIVP